MKETNFDTNEANFATNRVTLAQMQADERGKIVGIHGGVGMARKLDAMGIRAGKVITKVTAQWMRGPVLLRQENTQVALGFGMASKIMVELLEE
jgi:ferrous iron transport protein A